MTPYNIVLVGHILSTIVLFLGITLLLTGMLGMALAQQLTSMRRWHRFAHTVDKLIPAGAGLLLLTGLFLNATRWGWQLSWNTVSLGSLLLVTPVVPGVLVRKLSAISIALAEMPTLEVSRQHARDPLLWWSWGILTAVSLGILYLMLVKPALLASVSVILIAVGVSGLVALLLKTLRT